MAKEEPPAVQPVPTEKGTDASDEEGDVARVPAPSTIGVALSGGGFRATLFHLGVVAALRDLGALDSVTHVTAVSGGSVTAAHVVLNWDVLARGAQDDVDACIDRLIRLTKQDVRTRILLRSPWIGLCRTLLFRLAKRFEWARSKTELLSRYYAESLYPSKELRDLPYHADRASPELHVLATNLDDARLISMGPRGITSTDLSGETAHFPATGVSVARAVAASSAFPILFETISLTLTPVGSGPSTRSDLPLTDGGVFDNLGTRRMIQLSDEGLAAIRVRPVDIVGDPRELCAVLASGKQQRPETIPGHIARKAADCHAAEALRRLKPQPKTEGEFRAAACECLNTLISKSDLWSETVFGGYATGFSRELVQLSQQANIRGGQVARRNRLLIQFALPDYLVDRDRFDLLLISDAGKHLEPERHGDRVDVIGRNTRALDVISSRVSDLENEAIQRSRRPPREAIRVQLGAAPKFDELMPEWLASSGYRLSRLRTDMDAFSSEEVEGLTKYGYLLTLDHLDSTFGKPRSSIGRQSLERLWSVPDDIHEAQRDKLHHHYERGARRRIRPGAMFDRAVAAYIIVLVGLAYVAHEAWDAVSLRAWLRGVTGNERQQVVASPAVRASAMDVIANAGIPDLPEVVSGLELPGSWGPVQLAPAEGSPSVDPERDLTQPGVDVVDYTTVWDLRQLRVDRSGKSPRIVGRAYASMRLSCRARADSVKPVYATLKIGHELVGDPVVGRRCTTTQRHWWIPGGEDIIDGKSYPLEYLRVEVPKQVSPVVITADYWLDDTFPNPAGEFVQMDLKFAAQRRRVVVLFPPGLYPTSAELIREEDHAVIQDFAPAGKQFLIAFDMTRDNSGRHRLRWEWSGL